MGDVDKQFYREKVYQANLAASEKFERLLVKAILDRDKERKLVHSV